MSLWIYSSSDVCLMMLQVTNVKAIEKDLKAQKAKLSEDEAMYKSLEAKVIERERIGKACWFISSLFSYGFSICVTFYYFNSRTVAQFTEAVRERERSHV